MPDPNESALQSFLEAQYGGAYYVRENTYNIGTSPVKVLSNDFERLAAAIINTGANNVTLAPSMSITAGQGIILGANGGFLSLNARNDLVLPGYGWTAIVSADTSTLYVLELLRYRG